MYNYTVELCFLELYLNVKYHTQNTNVISSLQNYLSASYSVVTSMFNDAFQFSMGDE